MRAIRARYNPYVQTRSRVTQLAQLGHSIDKVEFIVIGGTFMSLPEDYRDYFIRNLHDALSGHTNSNVAEAVAFSERNRIKCIGITIETRPDYCLPRHLDDMLSYGCTRLEIGVQSTYEDVARDTNRGHTVKAVCEIFHVSKDTGYKVVIHMMPDLPNVGLERDIEQFVELFENPVRTREVGIQEIHNKVRPYNVELIRRDYTANGGWETFISYEDPDQDILIGLLRLRKCTDQVHRPELKSGMSLEPTDQRCLIPPKRPMSSLNNASIVLSSLASANQSELSVLVFKSSKMRD
ncbi:hypothetical protein L596_020379 [Steinernema carpocapsae]|uniref:Elp3/MiaA/NifB-like radical SAM core domain-containing protein n=1 Tax=Steinernema carpocapsae TaxID=34508 RepID=A0A4U5MTF2_STECR|nr:hypothetical protein L596_020379 [Steinernema carpocapsae]